MNGANNINGFTFGDSYGFIEELTDEDLKALRAFLSDRDRLNTWQKKMSQVLDRIAEEPFRPTTDRLQSATDETCSRTAGQMIADIEKRVEDIRAYQREYPDPIAVATHLNRCHQEVEVLEENIAETQRKVGWFHLPIYFWPRMPERWKAFYDREEMQRWFDEYAQEGDRMPVR